LSRLPLDHTCPLLELTDQALFHLFPLPNASRSLPLLDIVIEQLPIQGQGVVPAGFQRALFDPSGQKTLSFLKPSFPFFNTSPFG
jgi:hypothetical protein